MKVDRWYENPILCPEDIKPSRIDFEVVGVFNVGVTRLDDEIILLVRVAERPVAADPEKYQLTAIYDTDKKQIVVKTFDTSDPSIDFSDSRMTITTEGKYLTSLSHFRIGRSKDGVNFDIEDKPAVFAANEYETFGLEDPRITKIGDEYLITYVGVSSVGVTTCLISTTDFKDFTRHGVIFCPDNKDVIIFPEKINGKYYAINRPVTPLFEKYEMWISESPNLICWGNHRHFLSVADSGWDNSRIGGGAVPVKTEKGWLEVYHGVDENNRYCLGGVLLDKDEPWKVLARSKEPIMQPEADYEIEGFFGNVVFSCGLLCEDNKLKIYYGVSDTSTAYAEVSLEEVLKSLQFTY
jgi:predicted GH43/DUF377 family glycosyl hydrolase